MRTMAQPCQSFVDCLGDYVEGVLPMAECLAMDAHLRACPRCRELLADYRLIPQVLCRIASVTMPTGVRARLRRRLAQAWRARR